MRSSVSAGSVLHWTLLLCIGGFATLSGCGDQGLDGDGDGVSNADDNCPSAANADQADGDDDNVGDACDQCLDTPAGTAVGTDGCPSGQSACPQGDNDGDGDCDDDDNCPNQANPDQADCDDDGIGDVCDPSDCPSCPSGMACRPQECRCVPVTLKSLKGNLKLNYPSSAEVKISDASGPTRLRWSGIDTNSPTLESYEGILPGMLRNTTTQVNINLAADGSSSASKSIRAAQQTGSDGVPVTGFITTDDGRTQPIDDVFTDLSAVRVGDRGFDCLWTSPQCESLHYAIEFTDIEMVGEEVRSINFIATFTPETLAPDVTTVVAMGTFTSEEEEADPDGGDPLPPPPVPFEVDAGPDVSIVAGGSGMLSGSVVIPPDMTADLAFDWSPATGVADPSALQTTAGPAATTVYTLTVTDLLTGQQGTDEATVTVESLSDDTDADGNANGADNSPFVANVDQADADGDAIGDDCDVPMVVIDPVPALAGSTHTAKLNATVVNRALTGTGGLAFQWCPLNGPGPIAFDDPTDEDPEVTFDEAGRYLIGVTVTEGDLVGEASVEVTVEPVVTPPDVTDRLLTHPQVDDDVTAAAYYAAIDPSNEKDTLAKWKAANGFDAASTVAILGDTVSGCCAIAAFFDAADLGLGRRIIMARNGDNVAFAASNYETVADAVADAGPVATVAVEYSPGPTGGDPFVKFYLFCGGGGQPRITGVQLYDRFDKSLPGLCIGCHGGRPKQLVDGVYPDNGDTDATLLPFDLEGFEYACDDALDRADLEAAFKAFNEAVLDANPTSAMVELIRGWYGGSSLSRQSQNTAFVPPGWSEYSNLYRRVVARSCRQCHVGRLPETRLDFNDVGDFAVLRDRIEAVVFEDDEPVMPHAQRSHDQFWLSTNPHQPTLLRNALDEGFNRAPGASTDAATVERGQTVSLLSNGNASVLANDTDPDGDALTVNTTPVSAPQNGSLTLQSNGTFSYTHDGSDTTSDGFVYTVCDNGQPQRCAQAMVNITVTQPPPGQRFVLSRNSLSVPEGGTASFTVALAIAPLAPFAATVQRTSGDSDITVQSGGSLTIPTSNVPQTVVLAAANDADFSDGTATISVSASGLTTATVTAREADDDLISTGQSLFNTHCQSCHNTCERRNTTVQQINAAIATFPAMRSPAQGGCLATLSTEQKEAIAAFLATVTATPPCPASPDPCP